MMLKKVIHIIFILSCIGLSISIIVHSLTFFRINVEDSISGVWFLQVLAIGIAGITIILFKTHVYQAKKNSEEKRTNDWAILFEGVPKLYITLLILLAIYAFLNVLNLIVNFEGNASFLNGEYVLLDHGRIIKTLSKSIYDYQQIINLRSLSSGWIAIYGLVFLVSNPSARFWNKY